MYSVQCTIYTVQYIVYNVRYSLYIVDILHGECCTRVLFWESLIGWSRDMTGHETSSVTWSRRCSYFRFTSLTGHVVNKLHNSIPESVWPAHILTRNPYHYMTTIWLLPNYYLTTIWLLPNYYLTTTWLLHDYHTYLIIIWILTSYYLTTTWLLPIYYCSSNIIQNKPIYI